MGTLRKNTERDRLTEGLHFERFGTQYENDSLTHLNTTLMLQHNSLYEYNWYFIHV